MINSRTWANDIFENVDLLEGIDVERLKPKNIQNVDTAHTVVCCVCRRIDSSDKPRVRVGVRRLGGEEVRIRRLG